MNLKLNSSYGEMLSDYKWDYMVTLRNHKRVRADTYSKALESCYRRTPYIGVLFYVVERDSLDWNNYHAHAVLQFNDLKPRWDNEKALEKDMEKKFGRYYTMRLEPVIDNTGVSMYLTKYISCDDINYDFLFEY